MAAGDFFLGGAQLGGAGGGRYTELFFNIKYICISYVGCCRPLLLFLQCLTNLSLDPVCMLEQHWLKPENIVNNVCIYAGSNASAK